MSSEKGVPKRLWVDAETGQHICYEPKHPWEHNGYHEYVLKDAACFEVRDGYEVGTYRVFYARASRKATLSEALTIRSAEDVRREAINEAMDIAFNYACDGEYFGDASVDTTDLIFQGGAQSVYDDLLALIDTPAPSRETQPSPEPVRKTCLTCGGDCGQC